MCGFVGFTGLREQREAILHRMADRIIHRGPDMEGYHISGDAPRTAIALGFRRLSIIDLAAGKQPMYNEDGTVRAYTPRYPDVPAVVTKRIVTDLDKGLYPEQVVMPYIETVQDRITVEVGRGCIRGCRFCRPAYC